MGYFSNVVWSDGITACSAANFSRIELGVANSVPRTGPSAGEIIDYNMHGSSDMGMEGTANPISIGAGAGLTLKLNNYWNGTNDLFMGTGYAYQLYLNGSGVHARKSNASGTAGGTITWVVASDLYT
jgi:hypothetical protein